MTKELPTNRARLSILGVPDPLSPEPPSFESGSFLVYEVAGFES